jgi:hypothetical protein
LPWAVIEAEKEIGVSGDLVIVSTGFKVKNFPSLGQSVDECTLACLSSTDQHDAGEVGKIFANKLLNCLFIPCIIIV